MQPNDFPGAMAIVILTSYAACEYLDKPAAKWLKSLYVSKKVQERLSVVKRASQVYTEALLLRQTVTVSDVDDSLPLLEAEVSMSNTLESCNAGVDILGEIVRTAPLKTKGYAD